MNDVRDLVTAEPPRDPCQCRDLGVGGMRLRVLEDRANTGKRDHVLGCVPQQIGKGPTQVP